MEEKSIPCPEKFKESLHHFHIDKNTIFKINEGYENIVTKKQKSKRLIRFHT